MDLQISFLKILLNFTLFLERNLASQSEYFGIIDKQRPSLVNQREIMKTFPKICMVSCLTLMIVKVYCMQTQFGMGISFIAICPGKFRNHYQYLKFIIVYRLPPVISTLIPPF